MILDPEPTGPLPFPAARLREVLARPGIAVVPGCHDALGARLLGREPRVHGAAAPGAESLIPNP